MSSVHWEEFLVSKKENGFSSSIFSLFIFIHNILFELNSINRQNMKNTVLILAYGTCTETESDNGTVIPVLNLQPGNSTILYWFVWVKWKMDGCNTWNGKLNVKSCTFVAECSVFLQPLWRTKCWLCTWLVVCVCVCKKVWGSISLAFESLALVRSKRKNKTSPGKD